MIAGTLFAGKKLPLHIWFLAIKWITQEKNSISALELSHQLGLSYNATSRLKQKIMQAMKEQDDEHPINGFIQLDDAYWGGVKKGKRGRGAGNKSLFVAAVALNEEVHPVRMRFSMAVGFRKKEIADWAIHHIEPKSLVISDGLSCFKAVESADDYHYELSLVVVLIASNYFILYGLTRCSTMLKIRCMGSIMQSKESTYQGISVNFVTSSTGDMIWQECWLNY